MSTFDENAHPRRQSGEFTAKRGAEPTENLTPVTLRGRELNPQRVTIDGALTVDAADVMPDVRWNGWAVPVFTREETDNIIEWANAQDDGEPKPALAWVDGKLLDYWYDNDGTAEIEEVQPIFTSDGTPLYGVGAFSWVWSETSPDED